MIPETPDIPEIIEDPGVKIQTTISRIIPEIKNQLNLIELIDIVFKDFKVFKISTIQNFNLPT